MTVNSRILWIWCGVLATIAFALSGCEEEDPFNAVLVCNQMLESATKLPSCMEGLEGDPAAFLIEAPRLLDNSSDNGQTKLQIIDGECPHCFLMIVKLDERLLGGWRVIEWKRYEQYMRDLDPELSTRAEVHISGDVEWSSDDFIYQSIRGGRCSLSFDHVALWAQLSAPVHCEVLETPGQYDFDTFYPEDGNALFADYVGFIRGPGGEYQDVGLSIFPAPDGHTTGRLELTFLKLGRRYEMAFTFENVPIAPDN